MWVQKMNVYLGMIMVTFNVNFNGRAAKNINQFWVTLKDILGGNHGKP